MSSSTTSAEPSTSLAHDALVTPKSVRLFRSAPRCPPSDYETDPILHQMTKNTRRLGRTIPVPWQNGFRDSGGFRTLADSMVTSLAIPMGATFCPSAARDFVRISRSKEFRKLRYGDHESQIIEIFLPSEPRDPEKPSAKVRGMVFFVHGGAWGSGKPWFYRLVTKPFLEAGLAIAIVGYRVYPLCGTPGSDPSSRGGVRTQADDLDDAFRKLTREYPEWCDKKFEDRLVESTSSNSNSNSNNSCNHKNPHHLPHLGTIVVGHSSGAHIALLWMVERVQNTISNLRRGRPTPTNPPGAIDAFVGISGVYNIGHHFDYEGGRGASELSPLKPANGYDRTNFAQNSPPWKVQHELIRKLHEMDAGARSRAHLWFPGRILLVHGAEDDVVPASGTGEAAKLLKECLGGGSSKDIGSNGGCDITIDEFYVSETGHQDTVVDLMMLGGHRGPVTRTVMDWLLDTNRQLHALTQTQTRQREREQIPSTIRSKL